MLLTVHYDSEVEIGDVVAISEAEYTWARVVGFKLYHADRGA